MKISFGKSLMAIFAMLLLLSGLSVPTQVRAADGDPVVIGVISGTPDGFYKALDSISVSVIFDFPVDVDITGGTPSLCFETGTTDRCVDYLSGSGTDTLDFNDYIVQPGDTSALLDYVDTTSFSLNGGTIVDINTANPADLTLPVPGDPGSFGWNNDFVIDTTAPTISLGAPSATFTAGGPVTYTITYADTNFDASTLAAIDITLNTTGTANGTVGVDAGIGTTRTVTISSITGNGTLGISIATGTAADLATNTAAAAGPSTTLDVDNTASTVDTFTVTTPSNSLSIPVTAFTASDNNSVTGYLITESATVPLASAGGWSGIAPTTYTVAANGSYTLYPWAKDVVGNVSAVFASPRPVVVDITAPTVDTFTVTTPSNSLSIPVTAFTASDNTAVIGYLITESATVPLVGAVGWSGTAPTSYTVAANGSYTLYPWAKDAAGNVSAVFASPRPVVVDITAPTVETFTVTTPSNSLSIPVTAFTASDNTAVTGYLITESATVPLVGAVGWSGTAPTTYTVAANGSYTLYPWAKDAAGNVSAVFASPRPVVVDITAPTVNTFTVTTPSSSLNIPIIAFTASDNTAVTGYLITESATVPLAGAGGWSGTVPTTYTVAANGSYTLYPWVKDAAGNVSAVFASPRSVAVITSATFADVPLTYWASSYIERLYFAGITGGCSTIPLNYCPTTPVTRAQMAIFLLRGMHGSSYTPPAATGTLFSDVPLGSFGAAWIEQLADEGITSGCGGTNYCPNQAVTRAQMAIFLVRAKHGAAFIPPAATGIFDDVPSGSFGAAYIEQLFNDGITSGCGGNNYCPATTVKRDQMAILLVKTFNLP